MTKDKGRYSGVLKNLILQVRLQTTPKLLYQPTDAVLQALYTIMEKDVTIRCKKSDADLVQKAKDEAITDFKENAGFDLKLSVSEDLPEESYVAWSLTFELFI